MTFLDANVLLEVILKRTHAVTCEQLLSNNEDKAISLLTLDLVMYFVERDKLAWVPVKAFLESFHWLPIIEADAQWAFAQFQGDDFEDALQVACALREGCDKFVTLDRALSKKYSKILAMDLLY
ncbi:MAG: type II toxin-antitoxin system VapC family toxin [Bacteroidota bacterium]|nr:type II toxin-antitoxin system VapC family toxin [Bacteroidota bacterium]